MHVIVGGSLFALLVTQKTMVMMLNKEWTSRDREWDMEDLCIDFSSCFLCVNFTYIRSRA